MISKNKKIGISVLSAALILGGVGGIVGGVFAQPEVTTTDGSGAEANIVKAQNMEVRIIKKAVNAEGKATITVSYEVQPENATNQDITVTPTFAGDDSSSTDDDSWKSEKTVTDYVTTSVDNESKTVTINCTEAFGSQILVTLTSVDNPEATASLTVDYRIKREYSITESSHTIASNGKWQDIATGKYTESIGTLPYDGSDYSIALKNATVNSSVNSALSSYTALLDALKTGVGATVVSELNKLSGSDYNTAVTTLNAHKTDAVTFTLSYATVEDYSFVAGYDLGSTSVKVEDIVISGDTNIIF
ncbi:MAG: hypothetical protein IAC58_01700 [Firmicutes bacterium]|uniref:Uncharacterized protein n=1 Tax=Candidatus Onthovivens merdipullorum TaxID=2840889 RepID=A0A9D9DIA1_9BACL|nr:hypothetical protein [Candidatus Onthovivens merdipullorum]